MVRVIILTVLLAGCASEPIVIKEPVEVIKPIYVQPDAPGWLLKIYRPENIPLFVPPDHPDAKVALTEQGGESLREIIRTLIERDKAWREWVSQ